MSGIITSTSFAKALFPGVSSWYGMAYDEWDEEHMYLFDEYNSRRAYEEDILVSGFGLAAVKGEGDSVPFDSASQAWVTRYTHVVYGLGFIITREMYEDDLYGVIGKKRARALAFSMRQTKETVAANVYNRAFNASFPGGDGVSLLNSAHPNFAGGTFSNVLATATDLSEAGLEQACIDIAKLQDDRGLRISLRPVSLHITPDQIFIAKRILASEYRSGTGDNDVNALRAMGKFEKGVHVNHFFTDTNAWMLRVNVPQDGMKYYNRRSQEFTVDNEFDNENAKFKSTERYSFGWSDVRSLFGTPGA